MAKFDRASLLLALCVTVIISPWMPLSQCVEHSPDHAPLIERADCEEWAKQLHRQVKAERDEKKIWKDQITKIVENICNPKEEIWKDQITKTAEKICNPKQEIWKDQITKIAENICNPKQERVERDSGRSCNLKCDSCRQVLVRSDINDVVGYLYEKETNIHSFQKRICKDVETPSPKEDDWKQRFKTGAVDAGLKLKNKVCRTKHWFLKN